MRVIEPSQLQRRSIKKKRSKKAPIAVLVLCVLAGLAIWKLVEPKPIQQADSAQTESSEKTDTLPTPEEKIRTTLKNFTNQEFVALYSNFAYPNTEEITLPPAITGNADADLRIRSLAEDRGYRLRSAPISKPVPLVNDLLIQQKAAQPYLDMIAAAKNEGLNITITSAFRSVDEQKQIFVERLTVTPAAIAAGTADAAVIETLKSTAPPGYSRHHNGFTIDIACGAVGLYGFLDTPCFTWLSKDNFKNAKEFGWIPSYPDGVNSVGPEPEPWEYVWVGRDSLLE